MKYSRKIHFNKWVLFFWVQTVTSKFIYLCIKGDLYDKDKSKAKVEIIQKTLKKTKDGVKVDHRYDTVHPVLEDSLIIVVPEKTSDEFMKNVKEFAEETHKHYKPLWIIGDAKDILDKDKQDDPGVMVTKDMSDIDKFIENLAKQRFWDRNGSI